MSAQSSPKIDTLWIAVVHAQDAEFVHDALEQVDAKVTRLPSMGGFLSRRNATLLIGFPSARRPVIYQALLDHCRQRVEFIPTALEGPLLPLQTPTPVTVGGATVFALEVERFEEF